MYNLEFEELSKHKILNIESVVVEGELVKIILTTSHFDRVTTKPYWFTRKEYLKVIERMYI